MDTSVDRCIQRIPLLRGIRAAQRRFCDLSCDKEPNDGNPIFVTVHGTWKPDATWTGPDSKLLKELKKKWPCAGTYRFRWSGVNGARARLVAAEVLSACLTELAVRYPSSQIITISHSHGGNVVVWASTDATHPPTAAVYLNTPFIQVQRQSRKSSRWLRVFLFGFPFLLLLFLRGATAMFYAIHISQVWGLKSSLLALGIPLVGATLMCWLVPARIHAIRDRLAHLSNGKRQVNKELVVLVVGDEPAAFLNGIYFTQWAGRILIALTYMVGSMVLSWLATIVPKSRHTVSL